VAHGTADAIEASRPTQRFGLLLGLLAFGLALLIPPPEGLSLEGWRTAAVALLMATWWMTEAIPIPATGLVPLALFPTLGILDASDAAAPYANELIFLFMGGFLLAVAMQRWGLHKRIALSILSAVGTNPERLVLGFMLATAFLSMWISNTATTAMMLPIGCAIAEMFRPATQHGRYEFGVALMLGIAYAASIGGVSTLIGTPPNAVLAGAASELLDVDIGFLEWMGVGLPLALVMLPLTWVLLTRVLHPPGTLAGGRVAVVAYRDFSMTRFHPALVLIFHHVTVGARCRVICQVRCTSRVSKREHADADQESRGNRQQQ
jgi:sodium-dependent dicarboxylate transporter 2/3/5